MSRWTALFLVVILAGCGQKPQPTAIQRGAAVFAPVADKLAAGIVADLRKTDPNGYTRYIKEIGGKDESDLVKKISTETLAYYADALSMSSSREAEIRSGVFDDAMYLRKARDAKARFASTKADVPHVCKVLIDRQNTGEWLKGLELEFTARILEGDLQTHHQ
ncbi:MAG TPA: hypothetical protein VE981_07150 [Planctomycetota bacterium]|nr:hypothetical protein [Planctomycetota bacterium]